MSKRVAVIGIGAGDPEQLTLQAVRALRQTDVVFFLDKGGKAEELAEIRREICARHIEHPYRVVEAADPERVLPSVQNGESYETDLLAWHQQRIALYQRLIDENLADGECGAFLVWGDPSLYDSTLRFLDQVVARGPAHLEIEVVPGISAVQALAARHRIPLHQIGQPVRITTGRRLAESWPGDSDSVVVMLDAEGAFARIDPDGVEIYWGAFIGTTDEHLVAGPLADRVGEIVRLRRELRAEKGWLFDTYLLRRKGPPPQEDQP